MKYQSNWYCHLSGGGGVRKRFMCLAIRLRRGEVQEKSDILFNDFYGDPCCCCVVEKMTSRRYGRAQSQNVLYSTAYYSPNLSIS